MEAPVTTQQLELDAAPLTNEQGVAEGRAQLKSIFRPEWEARYDWDADVVYMRRRGAGAAISYISEAAPEIVFRLDVQSGELTGVDLTDFAKKLAVEHREVRDIVGEMRRARWAAKLPGLRRLARNALRGLDVRTREVVQGQLCAQP